MREHRPMFYTLDVQGNAVPMEADPNDPMGLVLSWSNEFDNPLRQVGYDQVGDAEISTVFLGLDYGYGDGPPQVWETAVFLGDNVTISARYASREQALEGHREIVAQVRDGRLRQT